MSTATPAAEATRVRVGAGEVELLKGGQGAPLLLLDDDIGSPGWTRLCERLGGRFTVYAPAHPGFGKSDRPDWARDIRDLALLQHWLLRTLDLSGVTLVGLGFGGWMAAEMAAMCPGRFSQMVLVSPVGVQPRDGELLDQFLLNGRQYAKTCFADAAKHEALYGEEPDLDQLEQWEINREMATRVAWAPYMFSQALPHLLPGIPVRTLVVWAAEDRVAPLDCARQYSELLPSARLEILQGAGHAAALEKPDELASLIEKFVA